MKMLSFTVLHSFVATAKFLPRLFCIQHDSMSILKDFGLTMTALRTSLKIHPKIVLNPLY